MPICIYFPKFAGDVLTIVKDETLFFVSQIPQTFWLGILFGHRRLVDSLEDFFPLEHSEVVSWQVSIKLSRISFKHLNVSSTPQSQ